MHYPASLQCFCSTVGDEFDEYGPATCSNACAGDSSQTCGGHFALSIYEYADYSPPPTSMPLLAFEYVGCYVDTNEDRVLSGASTTSPTMTTSVSPSRKCFRLIYRPGKGDVQACQFLTFLWGRRRSTHSLFYPTVLPNLCSSSLWAREGSRSYPGVVLTVPTVPTRGYRASAMFS